MADDLAAWLRECITQDLAVAQEQRKFEQYVDGTGRMFSVSHAIVSMAPHRAVAELDAKLRIIAMHCPTEPAYPGDELTYPNAANLCQHCGPGDNWQAEQEPFAELPCHHLRLLALPYADWPGYRQEWTPQ